MQPRLPFPHARSARDVRAIEPPPAELEAPGWPTNLAAPVDQSTVNLNTGRPWVHRDSSSKLAPPTAGKGSKKHSRKWIKQSETQPQWVARPSWCKRRLLAEGCPSQIGLLDRSWRRRGVQFANQGWSMCGGPRIPNTSATSARCERGKLLDCRSHGVHLGSNS